MSKHTPKPWRVIDEDGFRLIVGPKGERLFSEVTGCSASGSWPAGNEADGDFPLAAAAPDLAGALAEISRTEPDEKADGTVLGELVHSAEEMAEIAGAALRKAGLDG